MFCPSESLIEETQVNADNFLLFFREKLVPYVPGSFRIEPTYNRHNRILYMHLLGPTFSEVQGILGLNSFFVALHAYIIARFCSFKGDAMCFVCDWWLRS